MPLNEAEETQDLFSGRASAWVLFRLKREIFDTLTLHGQTQLALHEGLDEKREEVAPEARS